MLEWQSVWESCPSRKVKITEKKEYLKDTPNPILEVNFIWGNLGSSSLRTLGSQRVENGGIVVT